MDRGRVARPAQRLAGRSRPIVARHRRRSTCPSRPSIFKPPKDDELRSAGKTGSTLIASQLPVDTWHAYLGEPTLADAILDRLVHQSHRIDLKLPGESTRKNRATADAGASCFSGEHA